MFATEVTLAETTVAHYPLCCIFAVFVRALYLFGWHAASQREGEMQSGFFLDAVVCECGRGCREMFSGVDEAESV